MDTLSLVDYKVESSNEWASLFEEVLAVDYKPNSEALFKDLDNLASDLNDLDLSDKIKNSEIKLIDYKLCPQCNIPSKIEGTQLICSQCGLERNWDIHAYDNFNEQLEKNYNTTNNLVSFSVVGANAYCYNRSFLKTCANYSNYRANNNRKEITNLIYRYEGNKPPVNIINTTIDLFEQIKKKGYVYRGDGKLGVIAACLYYSSVIHNLTRTPKEVANIFNIEEKFVSQGDKTLQELNELGIISIPTNSMPLEDYINQYFPLLGIPLKYKDFIIHLITRMENKNVHIKNDCKMTTKIIGVIYLLTQRIPLLKTIKKDVIAKECHISKATFVKYYNLIISNPKVVKKSFKKYGIRMPLSFKDC